LPAWQDAQGCQRRAELRLKDLRLN
jgi:hypothetical protein